MIVPLAFLDSFSGAIEFIFSQRESVSEAVPRSAASVRSAS